MRARDVVCLEFRVKSAKFPKDMELGASREMNGKQVSRYYVH